MSKNEQSWLASLAAERHDKLVAGDPTERAVRAANVLLALGLYDNSKQDDVDVYRKPHRTYWFNEMIVNGKKTANRIERVQNLFRHTYRIVNGFADKNANFDPFGSLPPGDQVYLDIGEISFAEKSLRSIDPDITISGYSNMDGSARWEDLKHDDPTSVELMSIVDDATEARQYGEI